MSGEGFDDGAFLVVQFTILLEGSDLTEINLLALQDLEEFFQVFKVFEPQVSGHAVLGELSGEVSSGGDEDEQDLAKILILINKIKILRVS